MELDPEGLGMGEDDGGGRTVSRAGRNAEQAEERQLAGAIRAASRKP
jgi:hypothetical protein